MVRILVLVVWIKAIIIANVRNFNMLTMGTSSVMKPLEWGGGKGTKRTVRPWPLALNIRKFKFWYLKPRLCLFSIPASNASVYGYFSGNDHSRKTKWCQVQTWTSQSYISHSFPECTLSGLWLTLVCPVVILQIHLMNRHVRLLIQLIGRSS